MREKWNKQTAPAKVKDGQPVPQRFNVLSEPMYKPKLLLKSPSMRALTNYNNLSISNGTDNTYDNLNFISEGTLTYDEPYNASIASNTFSDSVFPNSYDLYDYTTIGSSSVKTTTSNGSELESEKNDMGSTTKLVTSKMGLSCQTWCAHLETVLCTLSLAAGFGNLYRLPQQVLIRGGIPFLVAYVVITVLVGLPLIFLELGIGQLAQEGFIKSWRAVPFFQGVGFVKLIAGCLLSIYYPLYMGLCLYYIIWISKGSLPFPECAHVKMKETGYSADGIPGQQCLSKTFLESPFENPQWYGIFAAILFVIWIVVSILSIRRTKSFIRSLSILLLPVVGCLIALTVESVYVENELKTLEKVFKNIDWSVLQSANVWYYAVIQVFFSTYVGFGSFITNAGIIYNKVNPFWTAFGYITVNLLYGIGAVFMCYILSGNIDSTLSKNDVAELHFISLMYTALISSENPDNNRIWAIIAFVTILLSGFISMATITYTLLKAITVQNKRRLKWWQTSIVLSFIGLVLSCAILVKSKFELIHLLDHYIVGNLILITVIFEVFAFITFYGSDRIKSDFEFMLGHILSNIWLLLWRILPIMLAAIFIWALCTVKLTGILQDDPIWLYGTGWGFVITMTILIFVIALYTISSQDGYTFIDKFKASLKPSAKWGPKDPMLRHTWIQWNSKAQQGERDFTLKRKGTRDFTRSIKKKSKRSELDSKNTDTLTKSEKVNNEKSNSVISNSSSNGYIEPYYVNQDHGTLKKENKPLRLTSIIDGSVDSQHSPYVPIRSHSFIEGYRTNINPLSRPPTYSVEIDDSDEYNTFRKGPYVIPNTNIMHVCHRRYSQTEDATAL